MPSIPILQVTNPAVYPAINGIVDNDGGWLNMTTAVLDNPSAQNTALFKVARHTNAGNEFVDLGVVTDPYSTTDTTYVILGISSNVQGGKLKAVIQFPPANTLGHTKPPANVWAGTNCPDLSNPNGGWNNGAIPLVKPGDPMDWLLGARFSRRINRWGMELSIPVLSQTVTKGVGFPPVDSDFRLYVSVVVKQPDNSYSPHLPWPSNTPMGGGDPLCGMPHPENTPNGWGYAYLH